MENFSNNSLEITPEDKAEVSLYGDGKVSPECLALNIVRLKDSFPKLENGWYRQLQRFIEAERFTDKRFDDAVDNLIKTCVYPEPTIASLLGYDKKAKLYTWFELGNISKDYSPEARGIFWSQYVFIKHLDRYVDKIYANYFEK